MVAKHQDKVQQQEQEFASCKEEAAAAAALKAQLSTQTAELTRLQVWEEV